MYQLFGKNHNILIPTALLILKNLTFDQVNSLPFNQDDVSQLSVSAVLVIPPWLTKIISRKPIIESYDILLSSIEYSKTSISKSSLDQVLINDIPTPQDNSYGDLDEDMIPEGDLICHLFGWKIFNASKPLCIELGTDEDIDIRHQALQCYLYNKSSGNKRLSTKYQTSGLHHPS